MVEFIGNKHIVDFLDKATANNKLAHSYIFHGPNNIGKATLARKIASKLLQKEEDKLLSHPDFLELLPKDNQILKEDVDAIIYRINLSSFSGGYKVLVVDGAHLMNVSASNAFLKTLEEPPKNTLILLLTSELASILPTIISRSVLLKFKPVPKNEITKFLREKHNADEPKKYANICFGRPGLAINFLKTPPEEQHSEAINEFYDLFFGEYKNRFKVVQSLVKEKTEKKENILRKIDFWLEVARDIMFLKYKLNDEAVYSLNRDMLLKISQKKSLNYFSSLALRIVKMRGLVKNNINIQLMLENLII